MRAPPWWTPADELELNLLVHELARAALLHRESCSTCSAGGPWCPSMAGALESVIEWREGRVLRSKAFWLRERQSEREEAVVGA